MCILNDTDLIMVTYGNATFDLKTASNANQNFNNQILNLKLEFAIS